MFHAGCAGLHADRVHVIDEARARNVAAVVDAAVAGDDDADLGIGEMRLKPGGRDHRLDAGGGEQGKDMQHWYLLRLL